MSEKPKIFLSENDDYTRPPLRTLLKNRGCQIALAIDREDAIERVSRGAFATDLLIVNLLDTAPEERLMFAAGLRSDFSSKAPVVAIASKFNDELQGTNKKIKDDEYIVNFENGDQLFNLLALLLTESNVKLEHAEI